MSCLYPLTKSYWHINHHFWKLWGVNISISYSSLHNDFIIRWQTLLLFRISDFFPHKEERSLPKATIYILKPGKKILKGETVNIKNFHHLVQPFLFSLAPLGALNGYHGEKSSLLNFWCMRGFIVHFYHLFHYYKFHF